MAVQSIHNIKLAQKAHLPRIIMCLAHANVWSQWESLVAIYMQL